MADPAGDKKEFSHNWGMDVLKTPPLIAPVRQFTYPQQVAGEEDAMARGALQLMIHPVKGATFLATCALGFTDPAMPTGVFTCPDPDEICAVAGGYAYIIDATQPEHSNHIALKPVVEVQVLIAQELLLFVGFHAIVAWGRSGLAWESARLSWEGVRITGIDGSVLRGMGWNLMTNQEAAFSLDLLTGQHQGGGFTPLVQTNKS
ncbi:MAG: hypothetical protein ABI209_04285 [Edaphobacter sp.]